MNIKELATILKITQALTRNLLQTSGFTLEELTEDQLEQLTLLAAKLSNSSGLTRKNLSEIQTQQSSTIALEDVKVSDKPNGFNDRFSQYIATVRSTLDKESSAIAQITQDYPLLLASAVKNITETDDFQARLSTNAQTSANELMSIFNNSRGL